MVECMICQAEDSEHVEVHVVERERGMLTICDVCLPEARECADCGHEWVYKGNSARPTCPECKGKRTHPLLD